MTLTTFKPKAYIACDSYKLGHMNMFPEGTTTVYSNFTPRSTKHSPIPKEYNDNKIVVFGASAVVQEMVALWKETFFDIPWEVVKEDLERVVAPFVGPTGFDVGVEEFEKLHRLGYLPLVIKSLPEGSVVDPKIPVLTVYNTKGFYWLTNYVETYLSQNMWKMSTIATMARAYRMIIADFAKRTGSPAEFVDFQGHDFSARGLSGSYDNAMVGAAHLTSFKGTDSLLGVQFLDHFYKGKETFVGGSVPATEHSVMVSEFESGELETYKHILKKYPDGIVSIVSDTYDFWRVLTEFAPALRSEIMNRGEDAMGMSKVVFRPDSGDPANILCGTAIPLQSIDDIPNQRNYKFDSSKKSNEFVVVVNGQYLKVYFDRDSGGNGFNFKSYKPHNPSAEEKGAVECLSYSFGYTENEKGFKEVCSKVGLIYGDSITLARAIDILRRLELKGFASSNVVLGIGSYSYQFLTRDTFGYAMKATYIEVNGEGRNLFKDPKTDDGTKKSACGLLRVDQDSNGTFTLIDKVDWESESLGHLQPIYVNGSLPNLPTLEDIRARLSSN